MFGSVVLDVAIGLALLFLFVSLICSAIREAIETVVNARAADLERGIREMLDDPTGEGATSALYAHPLIYPLYRGDYQPHRLRPRRSWPWGAGGLCMSLAGRASLPAYIPRTSFAQAFLDLQVRGPIGQAGHPAPAMTIAALAARAQAMPDGRPRRTLLAVLDQGGDTLGRVEHAVAVWFESCMDRVSGWYKRRTQVMLFVIGFLVACAMNVDAFSVGRALFEDEALRSGAVAQATALVQPDVDHPQTARPGDGAQTAQRAAAAFAALKGELGQIRFPTGWGRPLPQRFDTAGAILQALAGWMVTAFAVMLGAPFWFDLLSRFVVIRSAAKPE